MAKSKKLTSSNILQMHSKAFTQKKVILDVEGQNFEVLVDEKFSSSKLQSLVMELIQQQKSLMNIEDVLSIPSYVLLLAIKYFTNVEILADVNDFDKQMKIFTAMNDLDLIEKLIKEFDEEELAKIDKFVQKAKTNVNELVNSPDIMSELSGIMEQIEGLENAEVFVKEE